MIGNTPMLEINYKYKGEARTIYAKAEYFNLTGSIKDRIAFHIITEAYKDGSLKPGMPIVEATSGNTGISFSALGAYFGHEVHIFMPDWMSFERKEMIKKYGATLHEVSKEEGGFIGSIEQANEYAKKISGFRPQQFSNNQNSEAHYLTTGSEIQTQLKMNNIVPDALVAGVGTGGTIMGAGRKLKEMNENILLFPLEPSNSPTLSTGHQVGHHRIQGISDEFIPEIIKLDQLDEIIKVDDGDSIIMAQQLARQLGLGVGISSGANFLGAVYAQNNYGSNLNVVTLFSDDNKKYLTTDIIKKQPIKDGYLSTDIELTGVDSFCVCNRRIKEGNC